MACFDINLAICFTFVYRILYKLESCQFYFDISCSSSIAQNEDNNGSTMQISRSWIFLCLPTMLPYQCTLEHVYKDHTQR